MSVLDRIKRGWLRQGDGGFNLSDRVVLSILSASAAYVSWHYVAGQAALIYFPDAFVALHAASAILLFASMFSLTLTPYAFAVTAGTFVGRSLSIWMAAALDLTDLPWYTLVLGGIQWAALAWIIRPAAIASITLQEVAQELNIDVRKV